MKFPDPYRHLYLLKKKFGSQAEKAYKHAGAKTYEMGGADVMRERRKILILEDEVDFAILLKEFLEENDYTVRTVFNGAEGIKLIMAEGYDVIICDMLMPNLPGDMFYMAVEKIKPQLCKRFIFMTGHQGDPRVYKFIRNVRGKVLLKPFHFPALLNAVSEIIKKYADVI